ncbi:MAG: sodium:glutamate symporter [Clostridiaceae bacterium]|jgi:ESS family glutamate:Na+ symporter|nr:sodium:glutamate symporter [Clostridiaceae bacterium]
MNVQSFQNGLIALAVLFGFLFLGAFLRAKVALFRRWMLPASVIGGFIGLLLGPQIWGERAPLPFPEDWTLLWQVLPSILIIPVFAASPLGMFMDGKKTKGRLRAMFPTVLMMTGIFSLGGSIQYLIGYGVNMAVTAVSPETELYRTFGYELAQGFAGGHGTATALGGIFQDFGLPWWKTAQGVALTTATVGLIGGTLLGFIFINRASKKGYLKARSVKQGVSRETLQGYTTDIQAQKSLGRETTIGNSIETLSVHLGLLILASALAILFSRRMRVWVPNLYLPVWFYAMLMMYGINYILLKLKLNWLIDTKVKSRVTGALSEIAIIAAIMTIPIKAVSTFVVPILIMCVLGFIATYCVTFPLYRRAFKDDFAFERAIMSWGVNTGVMITGITLLKTSDPEMESPVMNDFSMGFALMSVFSLFITPLDYQFIAKGSTFQLFLLNIGVFCFYALVASLGVFLKRKQTHGNETHHS